VVAVIVKLELAAAARLPPVKVSVHVPVAPAARPVHDTVPAVPAVVLVL
jgi:hypothetical protein